MCLRPIQRPNPFFDPNYCSEHSSLQERFHLVGISFCRPDMQYIMVPCNTCAACVAMRQNDIVQRAQIEARYSHVFFLTLTYDNEHLPRISVPVSGTPPDDSFSSDSADDYDFDSVPLDPFYDAVGDLPLTDEEFIQAGEDYVASVKAAKAARDVFELPEWITETSSFAYANHHHLQDAIRHFRNDVFSMPEFSGRKLKYLGVSELGGQKGRPHFHLLLFVEKKPEDFVKSSASLRYSAGSNVRASVSVNMASLLYDWWKKNWAVNVGTKKFPVYEPLYTYVRKPDPTSRTGWKCTFDCHYVDPSETDGGTDDVAFYVSKYIMKASDREIHRKVFLQHLLDEATFAKYWRIIRSRMMISKGFGCHSETIVNELGRHCIRPDADVLSEIHQNCTLDAGVSPGPVFVTDLGKHRPLSRYYFDKSVDGVYAYTVSDMKYIFDKFDRDSYVPAYERGKAYADKKQAEFDVRRKLMESHEIM